PSFLPARCGPALPLDASARADPGEGVQRAEARGAGREENQAGRPDEGLVAARQVRRRDGEADEHEPEDDPEDSVGLADVEVDGHGCLRAESVSYGWKLGPGAAWVCRAAEENV